ncbi:hypothetical protein [Pseudonocardia spinosispora]|uniref:hypothetical protein n=1 Tax=Pseudonocardia spinosispora TaxID=103441 RepID=UPI0004139788|nr:hypothetical protein [Pseudonocardia spinosispora]
MNTATRLATYAAALAVVAGIGATIGSAVGPLRTTPAAAESHSAGAHSHGSSSAVTQLPGGLASHSSGYTFEPVAAAPGTFAFRILGPNGAPHTAFDIEHDKLMHLIVVRRDTTGFQHVHPQMAPDGTWTVPLTLPAGGSYRAFADFVPAGRLGLTLGVDLAVPGDFQPVTHQPSRVSEVDGYQVSLDGTLTPGRVSPLTVTVRKDGRAVTDLQPYLAAYGHLVALREGDLAYLHVHPDGAPGDGHTLPGPSIRFDTEVPTTGSYRLFLDFSHGGAVHTATFTVSTTETEGGTR